MTKLALGTSFSPMPNPVASALTETVCRPTSITTFKLISYNTMLLIQNLILLSSEILTRSYYPVFIHKPVTLFVMRPSFSTGSNPPPVPLQVFCNTS